MIQTQRFPEQTNRHEAFFFGLQKFVVLSKVIKTSASFGKKKKKS
jgi:hypothetical protein